MNSPIKKKNGDPFHLAEGLVDRFRLFLRIEREVVED